MKMKDVNCIIGDFKDKLDYRDVAINEFKKFSNIKKWIIYDYYRPCDADNPIRVNHVFTDLGWDNPKLIDEMFPLRMILTGLICAFPNSEYATVKYGKIQYKMENIKKKGDFGVYDLLSKKMIKICIGRIQEAKEVEKWSERFQVALERYAKSVHTIGNYMPCPDNKYNSIKGFEGRWEFNDRLDILYRSITETSQEYEEWKKWFKDNQKKLYLENILQQNENAKLKNFPVQKKVKFDEKQICNLIEWLEMVNSLIDDRGKKILEDYKKKIF